MPLHPGKGKKVVSQNIKEMIASGHPQRQAVAAALSNARKYNEGGNVGPVTDNHHVHMNAMMPSEEKTPASGAGNNPFAKLRKRISKP